MNGYSDIIDVLKGRERLLIAGHEDPDCDSLGAALGLWFAAGGGERQWTLLRTGEAPKNLSYLPGLDLFVDPAAVSPADFDAVLLVDCSELARAGGFMPALCAGKRIYCIDHHQVAQPEGVISVVEPEAAAACEIISCILREAGFAISDEAALCLYSGIASDTGGFRFRNTTPRCLTEAASLLPQIDSELVRIRLFEDRTYANMKMLAAALREMQVECGGLLAYSWLSHAEMEKYRQRLKDQARGACIALVAECNREAVGYINVYPDSRWGSFGGMGYPEIVDFGVLEKYRCRGFGSALMDAAEAIASTYAAVVYLGVGLHSGYGSAQRMYARRGYIPDGSGVWYKDMICEPYSACWNDDDLVLYLYKELHAPAP
ncbi:MAG: GNAT family N-acetyltransferase [Firmicutes bacterium]|nr:GNAT family N-acetyltransferase [Bacillota bacterium]